MESRAKLFFAEYKTDRISGYHRVRPCTRDFYDVLMLRLETQHGHAPIGSLRYRVLLHWHAAWSTGGKIAMAHSLVAMLRTLCSFGATILENDDCARASAVLRGMKFEMPPARTERLTYQQVIAIRDLAHKCGVHSIALAQAIQFECMFRQKDVLGEYVPAAEPDTTDVFDRNGDKWVRGIRWEEIDANLILRHRTSKKQKDIEIDLKRAPMVLEEFERMRAYGPLPKTGPIVLCEVTMRPWHAESFRRMWRKLADHIGIPSNVRNMDSRAGAITEATEAGADLEHVKHAATHSDIAMTQRYSRGAAQKIALVQDARARHRELHGFRDQ